MDSGPTHPDGLDTGPQHLPAVQALSARVLELRAQHGFSLECLEDLLDLVEQAVETDAEATDAPPTATERPEDLYEFSELIGEGATAQVWRVKDPVLGRTLAMKVLRDAYVSRFGESFLREARLVAALDHPAIVPIYSFGRMPAPDHRPFFTMREVRGRTLRTLIADTHSAGPPREGRLHAPQRRLARIFHAVCEGMSYAHRRGVIHRDLKPRNIMVGEYGEAYIMDWGLSEQIARLQLVEETGLKGTLAYMAPELLDGSGAPATPASDVYALGAVLYEMLTGQAPYLGAPDEIITQVQRGPPARIQGRLEIPHELEGITFRAMSTQPEDRYPSVAMLGDAVWEWLESTRRLQEARELVTQSEEVEALVARLRSQARRYRKRARRLLHGVPSHAPESAKVPGWRVQDEADGLDRDAEIKDVESLQLLRDALMLVPDYQPALHRLARRYRRAHEAADSAGDEATAARYEVLLRNHDRSGEHDDYLTGRGHLTLHTDQPVSVELYRYVTRNRRLVAEYQGILGPTPINRRALARGSYLAQLRTVHGQRIRYPFCIQRQGTWTGARPGQRKPEPIVIPPPIADGQVYVPAGEFRCGGDDRAHGSPLAAQQIWVEGFVMDRMPVSNQEFIAFLDDLVRQGRGDEALLWAPRERAVQSQLGELIYGRQPDGTFFLQPDADGDLWEPDWPVVMVTFEAAEAYARWRSQRDRLPWRLPWEMEWEKAARGVDGRLFPWGRWMDPTWCNMRETSGRGSRIAPIHDFEVDESPYGLRGMAGNVYDWCADTFTVDGPDIQKGHWTPADGPKHLRVIRGGHWDGAEGKCRSAYRGSARIDTRSPLVSFRLAYSLPDDAKGSGT